MASIPKQKGSGIQATIHGLKINPEASAKVPAELRHYLTDPILVSNWYPERDCQILTRVLAESVDPELVGGNVWEFFGRVGAQRDIAGTQDKIPEESRTTVAGLYRRFGDGVKGDVASAFEHAARLWAVYHDTGRMSVYRSRSDDCVAVLRLTNFVMMDREYLDLLTGYFLEFAALRGVNAQGGLAPGSDAERGYEWHYRVPRTQKHVASLALLPLQPK